jgi:hypothetical protein
VTTEKHSAELEEFRCLSLCGNGFAIRLAALTI